MASGELSGEAFVRRCERCGRQDLSTRWPSLDAARDEGALERVWQCPFCGAAAYDLSPEKPE